MASLVAVAEAGCFSEVGVFVVFFFLLLDGWNDWLDTCSWLETMSSLGALASCARPEGFI